MILLSQLLFFLKIFLLFSVLFSFSSFFSLSCLRPSLEVEGWWEGHLCGADGHHKAPEHPVLQLQSDCRDIADFLRGHVWWWLLQQRHVPWGYRGKWVPGVRVPSFLFNIAKQLNLSGIFLLPLVVTLSFIISLRCAVFPSQINIVF